MRPRIDADASPPIFYASIDHLSRLQMKKPEAVILYAFQLEIYINLPRYDKIQKQETDEYVLPIGCNSYKKEAWMFSGFLLVIRMQAL